MPARRLIHDVVNTTLSVVFTLQLRRSPSSDTTIVLCRHIAEGIGAGRFVEYTLQNYAVKP